MRIATLTFTGSQVWYWLTQSAFAGTVAAAGAAPSEALWLRILLVASGVIVGTFARYPRWVTTDGEFVRHRFIKDLSAVGLLFMGGMTVSVTTGWDPWAVGFSAGIITLVGVTDLRLIAIDAIRTLVLNWATRGGPGGSKPQDPAPDGEAP